MVSDPKARSLQLRHIQDHNEANTTLRHYWGYPDRVLPCTKDVGTCEYLDSVYTMHQTSMLYTFILWALLLGVPLLWLVIRGWRQGTNMGTLLDRICDRMTRLRRQWLLKDVSGIWRTWVFGRVSRIQDTSLHNTRTGLGGFADRVGAFAYALTPFSVLLSNRESSLSLVTGVPYQHFNFLHRWLGYIIFIQAALHTLGWTIVEAKLYQPQPTTYAAFIGQQYAIFGCVALGFLTLIVLLSTKTAIRWFGYEVFKIGHWFLAVLYIGACWGHWDKLWCWMVASLALMILDQAVRGLRMLYLHVSNGQAEEAKVRVIDLMTNGRDTVLRLDFDHSHRTAWRPGQHFYLCFPALSIWQSHPFTPSSFADPRPNKVQHHTYILRVRSGQTATIAALGCGASIPVLLTGPYGVDLPTWNAENILTVAGGTGVTFTLPVVKEALRIQTKVKWAIEFVWAIQRVQDLLWLSEDVEKLQELAGTYTNFTVRIFVTREYGSERMLPSRPGSFASSCSSLAGEKAPMAEQKILQGLERSSSMLDSLTANAGDGRYSVEFLGDRHPCISGVVQDFAERMAAVGGSCEILGSGPDAMGSDLRAAVSEMETCQEVSFHWDARE
nr:ferric/cupric reductase transmembrane component 2 [Quercus suber]